MRVQNNTHHIGVLQATECADFSQDARGSDHGCICHLDLLYCIPQAIKHCGGRQ